MFLQVVFWFAIFYDICDTELRALQSDIQPNPPPPISIQPQRKHKIPQTQKAFVLHKIQSGNSLGEMGFSWEHLPSGGDPVSKGQHLLLLNFRFVLFVLGELICLNFDTRSRDLIECFDCCWYSVGGPLSRYLSLVAPARDQTALDADHKYGVGGQEEEEEEE